MKREFEKQLVQNYHIKNEKYFFNALYDAFGLYSIVNWDNTKRITVKQHKNNRNRLILAHNNSKYYEKKYKFNENNNNKNKRLYNNKAEIKSSLTKRVYQYVNTFKLYFKITNMFGKKDAICFKCIILKNEYNEYIILNGYGATLNLYDEIKKNTVNNISMVISHIQISYKDTIRMCIQFIMENIEGDINTKILLFGMSMGGNMSQHISKELHKYYDAYCVSLGRGQTLNTTDIAIFEKGEMYGKYVSLGLIMMNFEKKQYIDSGFFHIEIPFETLSTLFIIMNYNVYDTTLNNSIKKKIGYTFSMSQFLNGDILKTTYNRYIKMSGLHHFGYYFNCIKTIFKN